MAIQNPILTAANALKIEESKQGSERAPPTVNKTTRSNLFTVPNFNIDMKIKKNRTNVLIGAASNANAFQLPEVVNLSSGYGLLTGGLVGLSNNKNHQRSKDRHLGSAAYGSTGGMNSNGY